MLTPIQRGEGTTLGERKLAKLADLSFFGLWSYPSVHRQKSTGNKEVADLIVVFGKDIIIFSEKDIKFPDSPEIAIAWRRWFSQSVFESVGQLRGAERHVKLSPLFLDAQCKHPFPLPLKNSDLKIHLVAICRNSVKRAKDYFDQVKLGSTGTLTFFAPFRKEQMIAHPFSIGDFDPTKTFVHVFDEVSLDLVLTELDSGPDFIDYLRVREQAIRKQGVSIIYGEEDFLTVYISNIQKNGFGSFVSDVSVSDIPEDAHAAIEEGMWSVFKNSPLYPEFVAQRRDAGFWKNLTNTFCEAILTATVGEAKDNSLESHERAVRAMASENRMSRALLGQVLADKYKSVPSNRRSARIVPSISNPERLYIFLFFPRIEAHGTYDGYRTARMGYMEVYARAAQLKYPTYSEIVVFGADTKDSANNSETVLVVEGNPNISAEEKEATLTVMKELEVLTDLSPARAFNPRASIATFMESLAPLKAPGVNEPCYCGSGKKYKKCCRP